MGNSCPKCSAAIEHDFGVFVCAKCGSVLFVDFDGKVQLSTPEGMHGSSEQTSAPAEVAPEEIPQFTLENNDHAAPADFQLVSEENSEQQAPEGFILEDAPEEPALSLEESEPVAEEAPAENIEWSEQSLDDQLAPAPTPAPAAAITEVNFSDVVDYANQTELDNTPLVYTLWIEGIDRKETREKVIEVLKDIKFNLHLKDILPTIKGGVLELRDLNPVKTSLIATRLREESVRFRWKQSVFQSEAASGT